jgi:uncharacterized protein
MVVYLDSVIVIYCVEGLPPFQARAQAHIASLRAAGDHLAFSDLTRLECRVKPIKLANATLLADFDKFFAAVDLIKVPITPAVFDQATLIRAAYNFKLGDSLHLAAAIEAVTAS